MDTLVAQNGGGIGNGLLTNGARSVSLFFKPVGDAGGAIEALSEGAGTVALLEHKVEGIIGRSLGVVGIALPAGHGVPVAVNGVSELAGAVGGIVLFLENKVEGIISGSLSTVGIALPAGHGVLVTVNGVSELAGAVGGIVLFGKHNVEGIVSRSLAAVGNAGEVRLEGVVDGDGVAEFAGAVVSGVHFLVSILFNIIISISQSILSKTVDSI